MYRALLEATAYGTRLILETFRDVNEIGAAIKAVRSLCDLPIVAQMTTEEDGNSLDGVAPETFVPDLESRGADVVGLNCSVGPAAMLVKLPIQQSTLLNRSGRCHATVKAQMAPLLSPPIARPAASGRSWYSRSTSGRISSSRKRA